MGDDFDDPEALLGAAAIAEAAEIHTPPPKRGHKNEAQEQRIAALERAGFLVVKGATGLTVLRSWWGALEMTNHATNGKNSSPNILLLRSYNR